MLIRKRANGGLSERECQTRCIPLGIEQQDFEGWDNCVRQDVIAQSLSASLSLPLSSAPRCTVLFRPPHLPSEMCSPTCPPLLSVCQSLLGKSGKLLSSVKRVHSHQVEDFTLEFNHSVYFLQSESIAAECGGSHL